MTKSITKRNIHNAEEIVGGTKNNEISLTHSILYKLNRVKRSNKTDIKKQPIEILNRISSIIFTIPILNLIRKLLNRENKIEVVDSIDANNK